MDLVYGMIGLAEQAALVFAAYVLVNLLPAPDRRVERAVLSLFFVAAVLASMATAVDLGFGVIADLRGALLVLSALVGGYMVGGLTLIAAELYRLQLGGGGVAAGLIGNAMATAIGFALLAWTRRRGAALSFRHVLIAAGALVVTTNLAFLFIRPWEVVPDVWRTAAGPISLTNAAATVMIGALLIFDQRLKRASRTAQRERDYLTQILNAGAEAVCVIGKDGRFQFFNDAAYELLGVPRGQLIGDRALSADWRILSLDGRPMALADQPVARALRTGEAQRDARLRLVRADGTSVVLSLNISAMRGEQAVVCAMRDVTREQALLEEIERQRDRLDLVIRGAGVGIWDWEPATGRTVFNERWAEIVGYRLDELQPVSIETWRTLCHPEDFEASEAALAEVFARRRDLYTQDVRMRHKDGSWVWVRDTGRVAEWESDGRPKRVIGTHIDITALKRANEELASLSRKYESTITAAPDGILTLDAHGLIESFNPAAERLFGWSAAEMVGRPLDDLVPAPVREAHQALSQGFIDAGPSDPHGMADWRVVRGLHKTGRVMPLMVTLSRTDDRGRPLVIAIVRDMTVIEDQRQKLEALTDRLIAQLREVEQSNKAKSHFLAAMSHELRTPLNAILGFTDLLRSDVGRAIEAERRAGYLEDIHASGEHLLSLINDILDLSKIEAGKLDIAPAPIDPRAVVKEAVRTVHLQFDQRGVRLRFRAPARLPQVLADRRALLQILLNLLSNAVKFTAAGGRIEVRAETAGARSVRFVVSDTGDGIPPEKLGLLGEPFTQVGGPMTAEAGGTGLGLAICKRLVERMGGRLHIESTVGEGTRVSVTLPAAPVGAVTAGDAGEAGEAGGARRPTGSTIDASTP